MKILDRLILKKTKRPNSLHLY